MLTINPKHLFKFVVVFAFASAICFFQIDGDKNEGWWAVAGSLFGAAALYLLGEVYKNSKNK